MSCSIVGLSFIYYILDGYFRFSTVMDSATVNVLVHGVDDFQE